MHQIGVPYRLTYDSVPTMKPQARSVGCGVSVQVRQIGILYLLTACSNASHIAEFAEFFQLTFGRQPLERSMNTVLYPTYAFNKAH